MDLRYVAHDDIDRQRYNSCVHYALNGRAWAYKWYLDATARRFDVLVEGEYESVMPLVHDTTWSGRPRLTTPVLTPALGVFSVHVLSRKRMGYFVREADARFDVVDGLGFTGEPARGGAGEVDWAWDDRRTYRLDVDGRDYEAIAGAYDADLLRAIARAEARDLLVHANVKPERVAAFVARHLPGGDRLQHPMLRVLYNALHRGWGWTTAVTTTDGDLLATNVFVLTHGRVASVLPCVSPAGREAGALDLLFDYAVRQAAGRPVALDFADADGDAARWTRFGAVPERHYVTSKATKLLGVLPL